MGLVLFFGILFASTTVLAGSGHSHSHGPFGKSQAKSKAEKRLNRLVNRGKIQQSWRNKTAVKVEKKKFKGKKEWVVMFNNPDIANKAKQTLYMFFKLDGHYIASNYTGN